MKTKLIPYGLFGTFITLAYASSRDHRHQPLCGRGLHHALATQQLVCLGDTGGVYDPATLSPWTHVPFCIKGKSDQPWCVFTNSDTSLPVSRKAPVHNHGISVVTTPELASTSLNLLDHLKSQPNGRKETEGRWRNLYKVTAIPGKGLGAVATERIPKGQTILVDRAMVLSAAEYPDDVARDQVQTLLNVAVKQLPDPERVYNLSRKGRDEEEGFSAVEDLLLSNSFLVEVNGETLMGLFGDLAVSLWTSLLW